MALLELRKAQIAAAEMDSPGAGDRLRSLLSRATHARA